MIFHTQMAINFECIITLRIKFRFPQASLELRLAGEQMPLWPVTFMAKLGQTPEAACGHR